MTYQKTISILGAGSMGTAIAFLIASQDKGNVRLWGRDSQLISQIRETRENVKYLPGIKLPPEVLVTSDLEEAARKSDLLILAVPSFAVREMAERISPFSKNLPPLLMISKGMEKDTSLLPFQALEQILGQREILHLTGVGYAKEIARESAVTEVLASRERLLLTDFKNLFQTRNIRIETSDDLLGVQLAGALKNVMVIGIGMAGCVCQSLELKETLIEVGVREMVKLGKVMGAKEETFWGAAGKGDLLLSADPLSRNYRLGRMLYQKGIREVEKDLADKKMVVEGFHTAWAVYQLIKKYGLELPMTQEIYRVIYEGADPKASAEKFIALAGK